MTGRILRAWKKNKWIQGIYQSPKSKKLNNFKSSWELRLYEFLDATPLVRSWETECVRIPYILRGKRKWYLPDILINGRLLIEVKPMNQIKWGINQAKFSSAKQFCKMKGWVFQVITKELMNPIYLSEQIKNYAMRQR